MCFSLIVARPIRGSYCLCLTSALLFFLFTLSPSLLGASTLGASTAESFSQDQSQVSVLGYHDFSSQAQERVTAMRISKQKFRAQMQQIKQANIPVISLNDFLDWRNGLKQLPPHSILITIDDGWKSVYTTAYPILKEFNFPFTVYLYKNYIDVGGRSLSSSMIQEMMQNQCTIGCHSVSHPFPSKVKKQAAKGANFYQQFLQHELGDSKQFLEERFQVPVTTYAYPGGYHTPEMFSIADSLHYKALFTCLPGKVLRESPSHTLNRYIILGNNDSAFKQALQHHASTMEPSFIPYPVTPQPGEKVQMRRPLISVDLSKIEHLDPSSLRMRITGFGLVSAQYDSSSKTLSWTPLRALRQSKTTASVQWRLKGSNQYSVPLSWTFSLDHKAAYQAHFPN